MRDKPPWRILALIRHNVTLLSREPGPLASRLVMPLVAITVFEPLDRAAMGRQGGPVQAVTGMLVLFSMLSLSVVGGSVLTERLWRTWDRLRVTPAQPLELIASKALPVGTVLALQQGAVLSFGILVAGLHVSSIALLGLAVLLWSAALLAIGTALSLVARSSAEFSAVQDIGSFVATSLGGALVPLAEMPLWARHIAPLSPGYWAMAALRGGMDGHLYIVLRSGGVLVGIAGGAVCLAVWRLRHTSVRSARL